MERVAYFSSGSCKGNVSKYALILNVGKKPYPIPQPPQDPHLNESLLMEPLLVADNLDRHNTSFLVINTADDLAERAFAK